MTPQTFAITGPVSLLKAMEEELVEIGFKNDRVPEASSKEWLITNCSKEERNQKDYETLFYWRNSYGADVEFTLPYQWDECLTFCKEQLTLWDKPKFGVGDWVIGWHTNYKNYRTEAWKICKINGDFIYSVTNENTLIIDIRPATPEEIKEAMTVQIGAYKMEVSHDKVVFGCQYITKEEVNTLRKFIGSPINAKISIQNTEITTELLNKILNRL